MKHFMAISSIQSLFIFFFIFIFFPIKDVDSISLMTYNVQNLFDTEHDVNAGKHKNDWEYLPLSLKENENWKYRFDFLDFCWTQRGKRKKNCFKKNWDDSLYQLKLHRLASVIMGAKPGGPDIVLLQEVENKKVVMALNQKLGHRQYPYLAHLETKDHRGIDQAILSRHKITHTSLVPFKDKILKDAREMLRVEIEIQNRHLIFYNIHFPSQYKTKEYRIKAFAELVGHMQKEKYPVIVGGDFNIKTSEWGECVPPLRSLSMQGHILEAGYGINFLAQEPGPSYFTDLDLFLHSIHKSASYIVMRKNQNPHFEIFDSFIVFYPKNPPFKMIPISCLPNNALFHCVYTPPLGYREIVYEEVLYKDTPAITPIKHVIKIPIPFQDGHHAKGISDHFPVLLDFRF